MIWFIFSALLGAVSGAGNDHQCEYFSMFHTKWGSHLLKYADCQDILDGEISTPRVEPTKTKFCECTRHDKRLHQYHGDKMNCHLYTGSAWEDDTLLSTAKHECRGFTGGAASASTRDVKMYDVGRYQDDASQLLQENDQGDMPMTVKSDTLKLDDKDLVGIIFRNIDLIPGEDLVTGAFLGLTMETQLPKLVPAPCANNTGGNETDCKTPAPVGRIDLEIVVSLETSTNPQAFSDKDIFDRDMHSSAMTTFNTDGQGMVFVDVLPQLQAAFGMSSWGRGNQGVAFILDRKVGHGTVMIDAFESGKGPLLVIEAKRAPTPMPTSSPSKSPSPAPTYEPSQSPSRSPTPSPSASPSTSPTTTPTAPPTRPPSPSPTKAPTKAPTRPPSPSPTRPPTPSPTRPPTDPPTPSPVPEDECRSLDADHVTCELDPHCGYDYMNFKCLEKQCIMVEDFDKDSPTFGKQILDQDNCGTPQKPGVRQECKDWLKENGIKRVKKNLAACVIQKSENYLAPPCCRDFVCQESGNCNETFQPTAEPTEPKPVIKEECKVSTACPDAARSCNRVYRKETGKKNSAQESYKAQCVIDWAKTTPNKKQRNNYWKSKKISKPWPVFEANKDADCCADFVCHNDPTECFHPATDPPVEVKPQVCSVPPDAGDCTNERRKCAKQFEDLGIDLTTAAINKNGDLLMSDCVQGQITRGEANDCCKDYVCNVKQVEGGLQGTAFCDGKVPVADPTQSPTDKPWTFTEWDAYCRDSFTDMQTCKDNPQELQCKWKQGKCGGGRAANKFKCSQFGFLCLQFKGCSLNADTFKCEGKLDEAAFKASG